MTTTFSTVAIGTAFEHHAAHFLNTDLRMAVRKVGGKGDGGIDLRGYWYLPREVWGSRKKPQSTAELIDASAPSAAPPPPRHGRTEFRRPPGLKVNGLPDARVVKPFRIIAQCKAERRILGPKYVRELEGTIAGLGECVWVVAAVVTG
jgi:hypothetical protein